MSASPRSSDLTHVAIRTHDLEATIDFYVRYAGLQVVHDRSDGGTRVAWLASRREAPDWVIVALSMPHEPVREPSPTDHLGFAVASREEVDRIAALARAEQRLKLGPLEGGPILGYFAMVRDPSGNTCEFSFGQPTDPRDLPR